MEISEQQLKAIIAAVLAEMRAAGNQRIWMIGTGKPDLRYQQFLAEISRNPIALVQAVVPESWVTDGFAASLSQYSGCRQIVLQQHAGKGIPAAELSVFPVIPQTLVVKTALCISDTFETEWITSGLRSGNPVFFMRNGLEPFSGKEAPAYQEQVLSYYQKILEYGIVIGDQQALVNLMTKLSHDSGQIRSPFITADDSEKGRIITVSDLEKYIQNGELVVSRSDIITDLARERAEALHILIKQQDCEVIT